MSAPAVAASDPMAWRRSSFASAAEYTLTLSPSHRGEIAAVTRALAADGRLAAPQALSRDAFAFPTLGPLLKKAYDEVRTGRGFVLLRGLPLDDGFDTFSAAVWGIGAHFGTGLSQNAQGELIGHVIDASKQDATPRMYRSNLELRLHNDMTAMLSLACWHKSAAGGATFLASAATIHDEIKRRAPELLPALYRGFHYHRLGEEAEGQEPVSPFRMPVFAFVAGQMSCRYQRAGVAAGHRAANVPLTDTELAALDLFDEVARAPENRLAFYLERGDMLVVNNYTMLHARTKFTEFAEPEKRRHLVRLWLDAPDFRSVPPELHLFGVNGVPPQPGRSCTFDFRKLYGDDPRATGGVPDAQLSDVELAHGR
ncbi:MAG TPA: TauD/TfdA family dioxygenase [Alphaproteobacteria bacterium]|nr:TauD/TfdA family dioxygenase [Alphaproteobacteria bacterium]